MPDIEGYPQKEEPNMIERAGVQLIEHMVLSTFPNYEDAIRDTILNADRSRLATVWQMTIDHLVAKKKFRYDKSMFEHTKAFQESILQAVERFGRPFKVRQVIGVYDSFLVKKERSYFLTAMAAEDPDGPTHTAKAIVNLYADFEDHLLTYAIIEYLKQKYHDTPTINDCPGGHLAYRMNRFHKGDEVSLNPIDITMAGSPENLIEAASRRAKLKVYISDFIGSETEGPAKRYVKEHYIDIISSLDEHYGAFDGQIRETVLKGLEEEFMEELKLLYSDSTKATKELIYRLLDMAVMKLSLKAYRHRYIKLIAIVLVMHTISPGEASPLKVDEISADKWASDIGIDVKEARKKLEDEDAHDDIEIEEIDPTKRLIRRGW